MTKFSARDYLRMAMVFGVLGCLLIWILRSANAQVVPAKGLVTPMLALVLLTGFIALLMAVARNIATQSGMVSTRYFTGQDSTPPPEWVERPARSYDNLLQLPTLFYTVCLLVMITESCDLGLIYLAWLFVVCRAIHAMVYVLFNALPMRVASFMAGTVTLMIMWLRATASLI